MLTPFKMLEHALHAPEAAAGEHRRLGLETRRGAIDGWCGQRRARFIGAPRHRP